MENSELDALRARLAEMLFTADIIARVCEIASDHECYCLETLCDNYDEANLLLAGVVDEPEGKHSF